MTSGRSPARRDARLHVAPPTPSAARSPSTTPRSSSAGCPAGGVGASRRPGSRGVARTRSARDQRLRRFLGVRLRGHERPALLRRGRAPPRPASDGSSSPSPSTRTSQRGGRPARPRVRARLHPPGRRPGHRRSPSGGSRCRVRGRPRRPTRARRGEVARRTTARGRRAKDRRADDDPTDHPVHRPVGRPAVRGGRAPGVGVGLRRARDRLLGRPPGPVARGTTTSTSPASSRCSRGTASRSGRSRTTSRARRSATTPSTSGTATSCPTASGATATPRASGSGRPRR